MTHSNRNAYGGSDVASSSSSSSITLMSDSHLATKPSQTSDRSSSPASSSASAAPHHHRLGLAPHLHPLVPVTTLREGDEIKTIGPASPFAGAAEIPDDEDKITQECDTPVDRNGEEGGGDGDPEKRGERITENGRERQKDVFDRFSPRKKHVIVAIVSYCSFISPITSAIFLPSIPQLAAELDTSANVIAYTVAIFIIAQGAAPLIWSPLSGFYGRRAVYITSMPIMMLASIGVALSPNVGALIGTRILQAIGGSCVLAVGAGSIGDIYRPTERGTAMGWYYSGALMGPTLAPLLGGLFSEYTKPGWRSAQYFIGGLGAVAFVLVAFILPETSHPPLPHDKLKAVRSQRFVVYRFNPFTSLGLFRWLNVCLMSWMSSATLLAIYTVLVPLSSLSKDRYNINNLALVGCLYLPSGLGNLIGARIAGPWADHFVKVYIKKRGYRRVEDRLRATLPFATILLPASLIIYGWLIETGAGGLAAPISISVLPSLALMGVLTPVNTYLIDSMPTRSAEVIAVNNFLRYLFSAAASAWVLPMSDKIGWGWTMTVSGLIVGVSSLTLLTTLKWGETWRERANERYHYTGTPADCRRPEHSLSATAASILSNGDEAHSPSRKGSEVDSDHGEHEEPGHLRAPPAPRGKAERAGAGAGGGAVTAGGAGAVLSRQSTKDSQMPPVQEVLKRTVSLSGASAHGGG